MNSNNCLGKNEQGTMNVLLIPFILLTLLFVAASGFGLWAFMSRQDYKDNVDEKIQTQVEIAKKETETQKDNEFAEQEKQPLKNYQSPAALGGILIKYPKTWSAYIDESGKGSAPLDGYFHPTMVPGTQSGTAYALRVQVLEQGFADVVRSFDSPIKSGKARSQAYQPTNVKNVVGLRIDGEIASKQQGIVILLPLRDKTIKIFTESDQYYKDFNDNILPNFSFTP